MTKENSELPNWLKSYLKEADLLAISRAVCQAERQTTAEIVPMIVRSSLDRNHVFWKIFGLFMCFFFIVDAPFLFTKDLYQDPLNGYLILVGELLVLFFSALALSRIDFVCRNISSAKGLSKNVWTHAELEFHRSGVTNTKDRTGILLFVSLLEHQAVVLADRTLSQKLDPATWDQLLEDLLGQIKKGQMAQGFETAILHAAKIGSSVCPATPHDVDELSNRLRIKEGFYV